MRAILKSMWVDSADIKLEQYFPDDSEFFGIWIEFKAGPEGGTSADDFRLFVCSPKWLKNKCGYEKVPLGQNMLIIDLYNLRVIKNEIKRLVENCTGEKWADVAREIACFAFWEFEDYHQ